MTNEELNKRIEELEAVVEWITSNVNDCWWDEPQRWEFLGLLKKAGYLKGVL